MSDEVSDPSQRRTFSGIGRWRIGREVATAERAAKPIQDKLDRLDEAFLFERSIDIETYDRCHRSSVTVELRSRAHD